MDKGLQYLLIFFAVVAITGTAKAKGNFSELAAELNLECPSDISVITDPGECGAIVGFIPPVGTGTGTGITTSLTNGLPPGSFFPVGTTEIEYTVSDDDGDSLSCSFFITVTDEEAPVVDCGPEYDVTVVSEPGSCETIVNYDLPEGEDNCGITEIELFGGLPSGSAFPVGITFIDHIYRDAAGNEAFCRIIVTVLDGSLNELECPEDIFVTVQNGCDTVVTYTPPVPDGLCTGYTVSFTSGIGSGGLFPVGTTTEVYTATNENGDEVSCSFTVTVLDGQDPVISDCPSDIAMDADSGECGAIVNFDPPTATDNCDPNPTIVQTQGPASGEEFPAGSTIVEYTVTDASGNTAICSFTVLVTEDVAPEITCPDDIEVDNDPGTCGAVVVYDVPEGTDNCEGASTILLSGLGSGSTFPVGITTETYQVTDASGNSVSCSFDIIVNDTEAPVISASDIEVPNDPGLCEAIVNYPLPVAEDNCTAPTLNLVDGLPSGSAFPVGVTEITYEAMDDAGNTAEVSFFITVLDEEAPEITCAGNIILEITSGACDTLFTFDPPVFTDNCPGGSLTQTSGPASGSIFSLGETVLSWEVTDEAGNTAICSTSVFVSESIAPVITCPDDIVVGTDPGSCEAVVFYDAPEVTDNCNDFSLQLIDGPESGSSFPVGTTTITYQAFDPSGNSAVCSFDIIVSDTEAPEITCESITVSAEEDACGAIVNYNTPEFTDNCAGASISLTSGLGSGSFFPVGESEEIYTVTDAAGNETSCSVTITVEDDILPVIDCPANVELMVMTGCDTLFVYPVPVGTDNCPGETTELISGLGSSGIFPIGVTTETYQVTDAFGNIQTCSFTVTVTEPEPPQISCPDDITAPSDPGICGAVVEYDSPVATDNCNDFTLELTEGLASGSVFPVGTTIVEYTVTDLSGNQAVCSFSITIEDEEAPVIDCPETINVSTQNISCDAVVNYDPLIATDNCEGDLDYQLISGLGSGATFPIGSSVEVYEVTDAAGNVSSCSFEIIVVDDVAPEFVDCPEQMVVEATSGTCSAIVDFATPEAVDGCNFTLEQTEGPESGSAFPIGSTFIEYTATDQFGNTSTCSFEIIVQDTESPVFTACPEDIFSCESIVEYPFPTATDNCNDPEITMTSGIASGNEFPEGETVVTFEAVDNFGNTVTCSFTVTVGIQAPEAVAGDDQLICNETSVILEGNDPEPGTGVWSLVEGTGNFEDENDPQTEVSGLSDGENIFVWTITPPDGCPVTTDTVIVTVETGISINAGKDILAETGQVVELNVIANPEGIISWEPEGNLSCNDCLNPILTALETTTYTVSLTTPLGCVVTDEIFIRVLDFIPSGFTPDGDGVNDVWNIPGIENYPNSNIKVFNRWGQMVFESTGYKEPWDGKYEGEELPAASYFYTIEYNVAGTENLSGTVTIIR